MLRPHRRFDTAHMVSRQATRSFGGSTACAWPPESAPDRATRPGTESAGCMRRADAREADFRTKPQPSLLDFRRSTFFIRALPATAQ